MRNRQVLGNESSGPDSGYLSSPRWTDMSFPATRDKQGQTQKPDFDFTELGLLFPQNDPTEEVNIISQMDHRKKLGTALRLHVHYVQDEVAIPNFVAEYRFYKNGDAVPGAWTTIETNNGTGPAFSYTSGSILQVLPFPEIPASASETVSANLDLIIYRNDNVVTGDVLVKYFDYHYQMDSDGSREEFVK